VTSTASSDLDDVLEQVTSWFCDDYVPRWVSVGNGTSEDGPEFILRFWGCPLHVSTPLRDAGYTHTVIPDSRVTVFHANGAAIDAIWSRRATGDNEIQRVAVHFELARSEDSWRIVGIQTSDTTMYSLDRLWPPHCVDYNGSPKTQERSGS
jgi:hypothetical protein